MGERPKEQRFIRFEMGEACGPPDWASAMVWLDMAVRSRPALLEQVADQVCLASANVSASPDPELAAAIGVLAWLGLQGITHRALEREQKGQGPQKGTQR